MEPHPDGPAYDAIESMGETHFKSLRIIAAVGAVALAVAFTAPLAVKGLARDMLRR